MAAGKGKKARKGKGGRRWLTCGTILFVVLVALLAVGWLVAGEVVAGATRRVLPVLEEQARKQGVSLEGARFGSARLIPPASVEWTGLFVTAGLVEDRVLAAERAVTRSDAFDLTARSMKLRLRSWSEGRAELRVRGLQVRLAPTAAEANTAFEELQGATFDVESLTMPLRIDRERPRESFAELAKTLSSLQTNGTTTAELEFVGAGRFPFKGALRDIVLETKREDGLTSVVLRKEGLRALSPLFERELTEAEVVVLSEHPVLAPDLLRIKEMAEDTSESAKKVDSTVPQDAFRHVLWSYTLTREFGPEFAEQVTNAHEVGSTTNTAADHRMDYNNNAFGRRLASRSLKPDQILRIVRSDPGVIRSPEDA